MKKSGIVYLASKKNYTWGLKFAPIFTTLLLLFPVIAGFLGVLFPAFGYLPAIDSYSFTLEHFNKVFQEKNFSHSAILTLGIGFASSILSFIVALGIVIYCYGTGWMRWLRHLIAPIIAMPHSGIALGLIFLFSSSGWLSRLVSPWLSGWDRPPTFSIIRDEYGISFVLALLTKEVPFLIFIILSALQQLPVHSILKMCRGLGYNKITAWFKCILPQIYPHLRLPFYAVLIFSLSVVDVALIIGPSYPTTLPIMLLEWFNHPVKLALKLPAASLALVLMLLILFSILVWESIIFLVKHLFHFFLYNGYRGGSRKWFGFLFKMYPCCLFFVMLSCILSMLVWSFTWQWRFPHFLPSTWTVQNWYIQTGEILNSLFTTLLLGICSSLISIILVILCLENEVTRDKKIYKKPLLIIYLPLLLPQVTFIFGFQIFLVKIGADNTFLAVVWSHLIFVLPYIFLTLANIYRSYDKRYKSMAISLGISKTRFFWKVKFPMLLPAITMSFVIGFSVSIAQYLPTLFIGGGRYNTITTEVVALASGSNPKYAGLYTLIQSVLPWIFFIFALQFHKIYNFYAKCRWFIYTKTG